MSRYVYDDWDEEFIPKYKSKKKKSVKKSSHKHDYEEILGEIPHSYGEGFYYVLAKECKICGKREITNSFLSVKVEGKPYYRLFPSLEEVLELYPNIRIVRMGL